MLYKERSLKGCSSRGGEKAILLVLNSKELLNWHLQYFWQKKISISVFVFFMWTNLISLLAFAGLFTAQDLIDASYNYSYREVE